VRSHSIAILVTIGFTVYASTAFGRVFVMKHLKLATVGVVYSVSMIALRPRPAGVRLPDLPSAADAASRGLTTSTRCGSIPA